MSPFASPEVEARFDGYPPEARTALLQLRAWVYETAAALPEVDGIEESLKWGEPAYRPRNGAGTTVRMDYKPPDRYALYVPCQTTLVDDLRAALGDVLEFEGKRAIVFALEGPPPEGPVRACLEAALTYHARRRM